MKFYFKPCLFLLVATIANASEFGRWVEAEGYDHQPKYEIALEAAKEWAQANTDPNKYKFNYEFKISKYGQGYYVILEYVETDENGKKSSSFGAHVGLYINLGGEVYDVFRGA